MSATTVGYTPGPWQHAPLSDEVLGSRGQGVCAPCDGYDEDQWPVDARLIAAAPDLLVSLREFVAMYDLSTRKHCGPEVLAKLDRADAAIAKAEGRSL